MSGGTAGAAAGTLTFMVGGEAQALEKARPILAAMGRNIFHAGPDGAGPVSYTHLDVYKRQVLGNSSRSPPATSNRPSAVSSQPLPERQ